MNPFDSRSTYPMRAAHVTTAEFGPLAGTAFRDSVSPTAIATVEELNEHVVAELPEMEQVRAVSEPFLTIVNVHVLPPPASSDVLTVRVPRAPATGEGIRTFDSVALWLRRPNGR